MAIGDRIKRIRNIRGITQKELGIAIGFDESAADVRVAQYESGTRTPKEDILKKIADALEVNYRAIYEPTLYAAEDIMYTLFELDEHYPMFVYDTEGNDGKYKGVCFKSNLLNSLLEEWQQRKKDLADGVISKAEYMEWKINWPQTCDGSGKFTPSKKWRKD